VQAILALALVDVSLRKPRVSRSLVVSVDQTRLAKDPFWRFHCVAAQLTDSKPQMVEYEHKQEWRGSWPDSRAPAELSAARSPQPGTNRRWGAGPTVRDPLGRDLCVQRGRVALAGGCYRERGRVLHIVRMYCTSVFTGERQPPQGGSEGGASRCGSWASLEAWPASAGPVENRRTARMGPALSCIGDFSNRPAFLFSSLGTGHSRPHVRALVGVD